MENKLEQLLNSLIEKGWKPRGYKNCIRLNTDGGYIPYMEDENRSIEIDKSIRDLTAKESGLWQFCAENRMVDGHKYDSKTYEVRIENWIKQREVGPEGEVYTQRIWRPRHSAEYRIIEASLKDESELEDFLLNSIKLD